MSTPYQEEANLGVLRHIGSGERILDVGCGRGRLGAEMKGRGNLVHGVEIDTEAAAAAGERLDLVHGGDVTDLDALPPEIRRGGYDTIVFADVLEHLVDPDAMLRAARPLLRPGGRVIVSLPNVATWTMRLRVLAGDFTYGDSGVLDRTHLRFFTCKTARQLLQRNGFEVSEDDVTPSFARAALPLLKSMMPAASGNPSALVDSPSYQAYARFLEPFEAGLARAWPELLAFQVVLVATDRAARHPAERSGKLVVAMISYNEEQAIGPVIDEIRAHAPDAEILIVDSSKDRTPQIAEEKGATLIRQFPAEGYGPAMSAALSAAAALGDVVVTMDCDGTYPADQIRPLADLVLKDGWDVVNATRLGTRPQAMPLPNWIANALFAGCANVLHGLEVTDVHSGMRAYRSSVLREMTFFTGAPALPVELLIKPARLGYRVTEVPIEYRERIGTSTLQRFSSTVWTFRRIFGLLATGHRVR